MPARIQGARLGQHTIAVVQGDGDGGGGGVYRKQ
jgi:hypothetical protein